MNYVFQGAPGRRLLFVAAAAMALAGCSSGSGSSGSAQIRLLNVSTAYDSLDLYTAKDGENETLRFSSIGHESVSSYSRLDSGTYTIRLKRAGVSSTLRTLSGVQLPDDSHGTFIAYGSLGRFDVLSIGDDQDGPDAGKSKVQAINTAEAGSVDIYITDEEVSLDDASPVLGGVGSGSATGAVTIDSGDYRLRITGAGDAADIRFDMSGLSFGSRSVLSLVLTATQGGVLVNVLVLPQRGEPIMHRNTDARIRAANGVSSGSVVTVRAGGVTLLSNVTQGAIGSQYRRVEAGAAAINVVVDGTLSEVPGQSLAAGGDYTLIAWNDGEAIRASLIEDDNRLPSGGGKAKLRLLNGMSALAPADPITLSLNYAPIVEGIALGTASDYMEVGSGSDGQLDVTNSRTGVNLLNRSSISLQSGAVYTMFMSGDGTSAATSGTLRRDR